MPDVPLLSPPRKPPPITDEAGPFSMLPAPAHSHVSEHRAVGTGTSALPMGPQGRVPRAHAQHQLCPSAGGDARGHCPRVQLPLIQPRSPEPLEFSAVLLTVYSLALGK